MKHLLVFLFIFAFLLSASCRPAAAPVSISNKPVSVNDVRQPGVPSKPFAEMSWTKADGTEQKLKNLQGKVVILDFWATYCPPCREEIPHLNSLMAKHGAENLQIIGLNVGGEEDRPKIPAFIEKTKIDYPIAFPEDELTRYIFAERDDIPQTAVFDRKGRLVKKIVGFNAGIQRELDSAVELALESN